MNEVNTCHQDSNQPEEWVWCSLGEIAVAQPGFACGNKNVLDGLIHLRMNNIGDDCFLNMDLIRKVPLDYKIEKYLLKKGDLLFCHTNSSKLVGKNAIFNLNGDYAYSNHLTRLRADPSIISTKWLWCILTMYWKEGRFEKECKNWVNQSALPHDKLVQLSIPLPPILEQHLIVDRVETLLERVKKAKESLDKIPRIMKDFRQAALKKAFSGELTAEWRAQQQDLEPAAELLKRIQEERKQHYEEEVRGAKAERRKLPKKPKFSETELLDNSDLLELPEEWVWSSLSEQADAQPGFACGNKNVQDGLIHLRMNNIGEDCYLNMDLIRKVPLDFKIEKYLLKKGDLLFCHTNSSKLVGKNAIFNLDGDYAYSNHLTRIRVDSSIISSKWLWCILTIYWKEGHFEKDCKNWVNQSTLPLSKLNQLSIPIPPLLEQQEIVHHIESLLKFADKTEKNTYEARKRVELMTQSILARAFRGDLSADFREAVKNWKDLDAEARGRYVFVLPEEEREKVLNADEFPMEPASKLLERIRDEREKIEGSGRKLKSRGKAGVNHLKQVNKND